SPDVMPMPCSDAAVIGMGPYRHRPLPIFALATLLSLQTQSHLSRLRVVVALGQGRPVGFAVDEFRSVTQVSTEALDRVPALIARRSSEARINAICRLDDGARLVSVLDSATLLQGVEAGHLPEPDTMTMSQARNETKMTDPFVVFQIGDQAFGLPAKV